MHVPRPLGGCFIPPHLLNSLAAGAPYAHCLLRRQTIKEYKGRIGPIINAFHKGDMFKKYAIALAEQKPLSNKSLVDFASEPPRSLSPHGLDTSPACTLP